MDDAFYIVLGLAVILGFPGLTIAAFVMVLGARSRLKALEQETKIIRQQLAVLARRPSPSSVSAVAVAPVTTSAAPDMPQESVAAPIAEMPIADMDVDRPSPAPDTPLDAAELPAAESPADKAVPPLAAAAFAASDEAIGGDTLSPPGSPPPPPPSAPIPPTPTPPPGRSLEESIGTRWTVWVGGLALALGAVFLVKYSIDEGMFTPSFRMGLAGVFAVGLIALGEYLRRREPDASEGTPKVAPIPAILTAAGTIAAFATIYASYALYNLIGDVPAFILLGLVAVGTMLAALLHGPWIATLGIFGAYATPVLIEAKDANTAALVAYLLAVTLAAFGVARLRLWHLVALWALALALLWGLLIGCAAPHSDILNLAAYLVGLIGLVAGFLVIGLDDAPEPPLDEPANVPALIGISGIAVLALLLLQRDGYQTTGLGVAGLLVLVSLGLAWRYPAMVIVTAIAGLATLLGLAGWTVNLPATLDTGTMVQDFDGIVRIRPNLITEFALVAAIAAGVFLGVGGLGAARACPQADRTSGWLAGGAVFTPAFILIIAWLRIDGWVPSPLFAGLALVLAAMIGALTRLLIGRESSSRPSIAVAISAIGTIAALGAGFTIALEKGALTIALVLMVPAIAWVNASRPIALLRPIAVLIGAVVLARVIWDPRIVGSDLGTTPIFNWLLYGYGVPTLAFAYAARSFRRQVGEKSGTDPWIGALEALTILFAGLLGVFELHHYMHAGRMLDLHPGLAEVGLMATMGLVASLALSRLADRTRSVVHDAASIIIAVLTLLVVVFGLLTGENPAFTDHSIGTGLIFNALLPGYLVPAIIAAVVARMTRRGPNDLRANSFAVAAVVLSFLYVTLMTRHVYQGDHIGMIGAYLAILPHTGNQEFWAYSAVWLVYGIAALALGGILQSPFARLIAAAIIVLTVAKVFLFDMSELTGIFRALSFIGLGAVLIGIGFVYQKWLFGKPADDDRSS